MNAGDPKNSELPADDGEPYDDKDEQAREAAGEILQPSMPPAGAGIMIDIDPRLNQPSETEEELKELIESNEAAEDEAADG